MIRILTSMIILLIITTFGYTDVGKQQKFSPNESRLKELISSEQFEDLSKIPNDQRGCVFDLILQTAGITIKHSIGNEGIQFSIIGRDEALKIIDKGEYYVEHREGFDTSLHFILSGNGYAITTCLFPGKNPEELKESLKKNLISERLSYIIEMKTVPKDSQRIHSMKLYQIKYQ